VSLAYPLTAIVGQEELIEALLANAVSPEIGGVLVRGERGTAKTTAVRGLASLLPPVTAATGQAFAFGPGELTPDGAVPADAPTETRPATLVELPLGSSLDRLVGALDLGRALKGEKAFEAGLLARAHQGILYVDEVNLLPDHLVDALLDAAATGVSRVERDAVSAVHAARFLLVGTMNVEEGELRPQLLDRFGLGVEVRGPREPELRAEIVRRRLAFERDPERFAADWRAPEEALAVRIATATARLPRVRLPERELGRIVAACAALGVDGVRGDIVTARTARALAALDGVDEVTEEHVRRAAGMALLHRRRRDPLDGQMPSPDDIERALDDPPPSDGPPEGPPPGGGPPPPAPAEGGADALARERLDAPAPARLPAEALHIAGTGGGPGGRRARSSGLTAGAIDNRPATPGSSDIAIVATLRARLAGDDPGALREHVRGGRESVLLCLVVDASGSMGARARLARVKGALLELLRDAYARRDRVAVVAFRDREGHLLVPPGTPLELAAEAIGRLATGGRTPLAQGLALAEQVVRRESGRDSSRRTVSVILTDGRVQDPAGAVRRAAASLGRATDAAHVIDIEDGPVRLGLAAALAHAAGARLHTLTSPPRIPRTAA
jgi:magnesium chelatase subunit D